MNLELCNQTVLVTGALGGIGRVVVEAFVAEGSRVIAADVPTKSAAIELGADFPPGVQYVVCDYKKEETIQSVIQEFQPEVVIANAGVTHPYAISEVPLEEWRSVVDVNLTGNFILGQSAARNMAERGGGVIVFIGSWVQNYPQPNIGAYSPSKAGMKMMALCLAKEMAPKGVRVNILSPGIIDTGMAAKQMALQPNRRKVATSVSCCGRLGSAHEVADVCLFLSSPRSSYVYGIDLLVDGGASLGPS